MKPDWGIDLSICTAGCTVERYRARPSRRAYIPKTLGIAALEDKIVQQAVVTILNQL
jgi:hypothetical protein